MREDLLDRVAAQLRDRQEDLRAEDIAREHLKLSGAGSSASAALVRAMLTKDERFEESSPGVWRLATGGGRLEPPVVLCSIDVASGAHREPWLWRVSALLWGEAAPPRIHQDPRHEESLRGLWQWLSAYPVACERPGLLARWMGAQERIHALSEPGQPVIDLRAWARWVHPAAGVAEERGEPRGGLHGPSRRDREAAGGRVSERSPGWSPDAVAEEPVAEEPVAAAFQPLADRMDGIAAVAAERGLATWHEVALWPQAQAAAGREAIWNEAWDFTQADLDALPEEPGVYRFLGEDGETLYVGKAKDLRARVASYFRPLESKSSRRAAFLEKIRSLVTETTGTELEALIREAAAIRAESPVWNTQIQTLTGAQPPTAADEEMILLIPATEDLRLFALCGERLAIGRVSPGAGAEPLCEALRSYYVEGGDSETLPEVAGPERKLARRWFQGHDRPGAVLRMTDFPTYAAVAEAIVRIATEQAETASSGAEAAWIRSGR